MYIKKISLTVDYGSGMLVLDADSRPESGLEAKIWDILDKALDPMELLKIQKELSQKQAITA